MIIRSMLKMFSGEENDTQYRFRNDPRHEGRDPEAVEQVTYAEVSALKSKDELVTQVQTKYALDKVQAQKDVDAFAKGRQL
jgi:predicted site-specific integrase-resolvase